MAWPGQKGSLRELIERGILAILEELEVIKYQMDQQDLGNPNRVDLIFQVASISEGLHELETRVQKLEQHKNAVSWLLGLTTAMSFGVLLAYLIGLLR
jgi:hypothetical protein